METHIVNYCQSHYYLKLKEFSNQLWRNRFVGSITALLINIVLFSSLRKSTSLLSIAIQEFIIYVIVSYILTLLYPEKEDQDLNNLSQEE